MKSVKLRDEKNFFVKIIRDSNNNKSVTISLGSVFGVTEVE